MAAIDCTKKGGYIVYSTCSVTIQENEWVIDYAIRNRFVKVVETGLQIGEEGYTKFQDKRFDPSVKLTSKKAKYS
jgi:ribosomal RNA methyltransferase Nop2